MTLGLQSSSGPCLLGTGAPLALEVGRGISVGSEGQMMHGKERGEKRMRRGKLGCVLRGLEHGDRLSLGDRRGRERKQERRREQRETERGHGGRGDEELFAGMRLQSWSPSHLPAPGCSVPCALCSRPDHKFLGGEESFVPQSLASNAMLNE